MTDLDTRLTIARSYRKTLEDSLSLLNRRIETGFGSDTVMVGSINDITNDIILAEGRLIKAIQGEQEKHSVRS